MKLFIHRTAFALAAWAFLVVPSTDVLADGPQIVRQARKPAPTRQPNEKPASDVQRQTIVDVSLQTGGLLRGFLVDEQGRPLVRTAVTIRQGRRILSRVETGPRGEFQFTGLRGGVYEIASIRGQNIFRLWAPGTAPKTARRQALIVAQARVVRGQFGDLGLSTLTNLGDIGALGGMGSAGTVATVAAVAGITVGAVVIANEANDDDPPATMMDPGMATP